MQEAVGREGRWQAVSTGTPGGGGVGDGERVRELGSVPGDTHAQFFVGVHPCAREVGNKVWVAGPAEKDTGR